MHLSQASPHSHKEKKTNTKEPKEHTISKVDTVSAVKLVLWGVCNITQSKNFNEIVNTLPIFLVLENNMRELQVG